VEEDAEEDAEDQRRYGERRSEGNRGTSDTLLIRDRRSPLHSRCTAGDSPRPSHTPRTGFLSTPHGRPAPCVRDLPQWWTPLFFTRRRTEGELFRQLKLAGKKGSIGCAKCAGLCLMII